MSKTVKSGYNPITGCEFCRERGKCKSLCIKAKKHAEQDWRYQRESFYNIQNRERVYGDGHDE